MNKIRELRVNLGYTQKNLAEFIGCNQSAVGKYEREELEPNIDTLCKMANLFKCSIDYIVGREDDFGIINSNESEYTSAEKRIIAIYRALTEREKALFDNLVNSFEDSNSNSKKSSRA